MSDNDAIIARIKGVPATKGTAESDADPRNPNEPTIPAQIMVGRIRFRTGVKVSTVQGAIDRLADRFLKYDEALWKIRKVQGLPDEARKLIEEAAKL